MSLRSLGILEDEIQFRFARSSGPGGQNVNKVNSKVLLRWNVEASALREDIKLRFREKYPQEITKAGDVVITSEQYRDQSRNKEVCLERLYSMLSSVRLPPKKRKKTKPSRSAKEKRITQKKQIGAKKASRKKDF